MSKNQLLKRTMKNNWNTKLVVSGIIHTNKCHPLILMRSRKAKNYEKRQGKVDVLTLRLPKYNHQYVAQTGSVQTDDLGDHKNRLTKASQSL